jgi:hypothetical protein
VDGLGGYADGPDNRWQRYPDRGAGGREPEPERDPRPFGERPPDAQYETRPFGERESARRGDPDEGYRVPEPRFGDLPGPRYPDPADPLFGDRPEPGGRPRDERYDTGAGRFEPVRDRGAGFDAAPFPPQQAVPRDEPERGPLPPRVEPPEEREHHLTEQIDRAALRRPPVVPTATPTVYRTRRPGLIILLAIGTSVVELLLLFVLGHAVIHGFPAGELLAAVFAMAGAPLTSLGLYAMVSGGGSAGQQAWLRAPAGYLPVGLVLLVAAAIAAG